MRTEDITPQWLMNVMNDCGFDTQVMIKNVMTDRIYSAVYEFRVSENYSLKYQKCLITKK